RDGDALLEQVDDLRVDVRLARNSRCVAQVAGDFVVSAGDGPLASGGRGDRRRHRQGDRHQHRRVPGPEVLGGHVDVGQVAQVIVDVAAADVVPVTLVILVGEQFVATATSPLQDRDESPHVVVDERHDAVLAAFRVVLEDQRVAVDGDVVFAQGGQAISAV